VSEAWNSEDCAVCAATQNDINPLKVCQILTHLALGYVLAGDRPAPALTCIAKLRQLGEEHAADPRICFLALKALIPSPPPPPPILQNPTL